MFNWLKNKFSSQKGRFQQEIIIPNSPFLGNTYYGQSHPAYFERNLSSYTSEVWVYACVYLISTTISGLDFKLYKRKYSNGKLEKNFLYDDRIYKLFENPNDTDENSTFGNLIEWTSACLELVGNSYWLLDKLYGQNKRFVGSLYVLNPSKVSIVLNTENPNISHIKGYNYTLNNGSKKFLTNDEVTHFKYIKPNDYLYGQGAVVACATAIDLIRNASDTNNNLFKNGIVASGALETDKDISQDKFNRIKMQFDTNYQGVKKAHRTIVLDSGLKYKVITQTMKDMDFIEGIKLNREEICAAFGVPPVLVGILDKATYSNYEQALKNFWVHTLIPKVHRIEQVITKVVQRFDPTLFFEFDLSKVEVLKSDQDKLSQIAQRYFAMGVPFNIIKDALDLPFPEIEGGDIGYLPFSLAPANSINEKPESQTPAENPVDEDSKSKNLFRSLQKEYLRKSYDRLTTILTNKYMGIIEPFFKNLGNKVINKLGTLKSINKDQYDDIMFPRDEAINDWLETNKRVHKTAIKSNGQRELNNLNLGISFDVSNPRVADYIAGYSRKVSSETIKTYYDDIKQQIIEGSELGESIPDISKRINTIISDYGFGKWKGEQIARTEMISCSNFGALEGYKQSGLRLKKGWLATTDDRTRPEHYKAGETYDDNGAIGMDDMFELVDGTRCLTPGDTGNPAHDINCRCSIYAVTED